MNAVSVEQFASGVLTDNALFAQATALGEAITPAEMIELLAESRSLYNLCVLTSRELERVRECHQLWQAAAEIFEQMSKVWSDENLNELAGLHVSLCAQGLKL